MPAAQVAGKVGRRVPREAAAMGGDGRSQRRTDTSVVTEASSGDGGSRASDSDSESKGEAEAVDLLLLTVAESADDAVAATQAAK